MVDLILGQHTDVYFKAFQRQWQFIKNYQIDNEFHGVYETVGPDGNPVNANKGRIWKAAYRDRRALLNISERLRLLAGAGTKNDAAEKCSLCVERTTHTCDPGLQQNAS